MLTFTDELFEQFVQQHASELLHGQSDVKLWRQIVVKVVYECALREHVRYPVQTTAQCLNLERKIVYRYLFPNKKT